jgi:hypothetical protein
MARARSFVENGCWVLRATATLRFELHWSLPFFPLMTRCLTPVSFALAIAVLAAHELGHAAVVGWRGLRSHAIRMHGMGGHCLHDGGTALDEAWIAWGGVAAQAPLLALGAALPWLVSPGWLSEDLFRSLVLANGSMIAFNLLPIRGLDGHKAWGLFRLLRSARVQQRQVGDRWAAKDRAMWQSIEAAKKKQAERERLH